MPRTKVVRYGTHSFGQVYDTGSDWFTPGRHAKVTPWWHHPNHNYEGRHRGDYQFRLTHSGLPVIALPYGLRSVRITPYLDAAETQFGEPTVVTLPNVSIIDVDFKGYL